MCATTNYVALDGQHKVTHPVVGNLSGWPPQDIAALELALRHRRTLAALHVLDNQTVQLRRGAGIGAVWRLAETRAACAVLETAPFTEDHLYASLAWLADERPHIEQRLQRRTPPAPFSGVVLYDVTSSHLEGRGNAPADWVTTATARAANAKSSSACCATRAAGRCQWKPFAATRPA